MTLNERQDSILKKIVEEYITTAKPVASRKLVKKCKLGLSPATIRNEMQKLTKEGFLFQPHTSAGRVPTDKGYRFFVDNIFDRFSDLEEDLRIDKETRKTIEDLLKFIQTVNRTLAVASSSLAVSYLFDDRILWKEGWKEVLQEPEFQETGLIFNFANLLRDFEEGIEDFKLNSGIKVYIGRENPFSKAKDFSIIISQCCFPEEEKGIISLLGPKRMAYDRNIALIKTLKETLDNL